MENEIVEILIVEDSPTQAAQLQHILERNHLRVLLASDGLQALAALELHRPRLVLSDIVMPGMDGYELCRHIKSDERFKDLPVILITSLSDLKDVLKGLECFADSFVVKPYEERHLLARIEYILANERLRARRNDQEADPGKLELFFGGDSHFLARLPKVENTIDLLLGAYQTLVEKNSALSVAKEEAERASRAKSEFLSRMSHELRTPLNAVLGFAQILSLEEEDASKRDSLEQILNSGRHLLGLIDDVLDLAKIEAGRLALALEAVSVDELLRDCVKQAEAMAVARQITIENGRSGLGRRIKADRRRLRQVLLNLLSYAAKFHGDDVSGVTVSTEETMEDRLRIRISDPGCSLSPGKLARVFAPLEQLSAPALDGDEAGQALSLSQRLMELMGGAVGVENPSEQGSVYWIELPLWPEPAAEPASAPPGSVAVGPGEERSEVTVVYIEDNPSNLKLVQRLVARRPGINLLSASRGLAGLDLVRQHRPDLVLLDLHLPDISGQEVIARLRSDPETRDCPVVVISADAAPGEIARCRAAGANHYLTKPLEVREFLETLDRTLAGRWMPDRETVAA